MTTEISKTPKNKSVFQNFPDYLKEFWKQDNTRPWNVYFKEEQFFLFLGYRKGRPEMSPEDIKTLKIMLATWKFEIIESVEEMFREILIDKHQRSKDETAKRRERCW